MDTLPTEALAGVADGAPSGVSCPACLGGRLARFGTKGDYALLRCRGCGTITASVPARGGAEDQINDLYDHYYEGASFEPRPAAARSLDDLARSCEPFRLTGRWLDVGFGEGTLLGLAEARGWRCHGVEISPRPLAFGEARGWVVSADPTHDPRFPAGGFDVVTMVEVLEHVARPDDHLRAAAVWLRPGGLLYLTTPNARSLNTRVQGAGWSVFCPPEHLTIWSARGLRHALARSGFLPRRTLTTGLNPSEILARMRLSMLPAHRREAEPAVSRNLTAFQLNDAFSRNKFRRGVKAAINVGLSLFQAGDDLKVWAVRSGGD